MRPLRLILFQFNAIYRGPLSELLIKPQTALASDLSAAAVDAFTAE